MEKYEQSVSLDRFRRDALHRMAMCNAFGEEDGRYTVIAMAAEISKHKIDSRRDALERGEDLLVQARALERARKIKTTEAYQQARLDLTAAVRDVVRTLLPVTPSQMAQSSVGRVRDAIQSSIANLSREETPEEVRQEHVPALQRELEALTQADEAEDNVDNELASLRAATNLLKTQLNAEREVQFGQLVAIAGSRDVADEFFLPSYDRSEPKKAATPDPKP